MSGFENITKVGTYKKIIKNDLFIFCNTLELFICQAGGQRCPLTFRDSICYIDNIT